MIENQKLSKKELDDLMAQIEQMLGIMEELYQKNMSWLQVNYNDIYKLSKKEAKKILKDKSKEIYAIELNSLGAVDIIDRRTNKFFYEKDAWLFGDRVANGLKNINSIAFVGTALGTHIASTIKFNKPKKVLICEDDIQLFRTSLYIIDYSELNSMTKLSLSVGGKCKTKKYDTVYRLKV